MPRKNEEPELELHFEDEEPNADLAALVEQVREVKMRNDQLKAENEMLRSQRQEREEFEEEEFEEEEFEEEAPPLSFSEKPGLVLTNLALVVIVRAILFALIEDFGKFGRFEDIAANIAAWLGGFHIVGSWAEAEWKKSKWMIIPRLLILILGGVLGTTCFWGPGVWDGVFGTIDPLQTWLTVGILVFSIVLAASEVPVDAMNAIRRLIGKE